jgi:hypothetical protein
MKSQILFEETQIGLRGDTLLCVMHVSASAEYLLIKSRRYLRRLDHVT